MKRTEKNKTNKVGQIGLQCWLTLCTWTMGYYIWAIICGLDLTKYLGYILSWMRVSLYKIYYGTMYTI